MRIGDKYCPGILHAVSAKDGLLSRIRVPGGLITFSQLAAIAESSSAFADGEIEITSRANLQLRSIKAEHVDEFVRVLSSAGLLPSPRHDRVRNIVTSPFAGLDVEEIIDPRPLVEELDRLLLENLELANLPPKFNFAIDGGGNWFSRDPDDLALHAVKLEGVIYFHLSVGGNFSGLGASADDAVECVVEAARICLDIAREFGLPARGRKIASVPQAMRRLLDSLSQYLVPRPLPTRSRLVADMPVGVYATKRVGYVSLVPSVPLGRLTVEQARCIGLIVREWDGDLRLAPWRGVVLGSLPESSIGQISARLRTAGMSCDGKDGYKGIAACAGSDGCDASLADVRRDATILASRLSGCNTSGGWSVNLSGCEKQCAMRNGALVELTAGVSGYSLKMGGDCIAFDGSIESAVEAIVAYRAGEGFEDFRGDTL